MKNQLTCSIVQDLLPNYIEKMTSDETNKVIEQHLDSCENCKSAYEQMAVDIDNPVKAPVIELNFLKKVKRIRLLAAALCVVLTLIFSYLIYASEYKYSYDKADLSAAITEFASPFDPVDAYVLETKEIDGMLIASFKDRSRDGVNGIAVLLKGFNQKYRIVSSKINSAEYTSVVQIFPVELKDQQYYVVSGYNLSDEIRYYGLDYATYSEPGTLSDNRIMRSLKYEVKNLQFLELYPAEELNSLLENSSEETLHSYYLVATSLYDADGREITEEFINQESTGDRVSSSTGKAELFMLYVFIIIVMGLGYIFTRYFLTD
jgi:hypothetical protein